MKHFDWAEALLVIDMPDERTGARAQFDHMHAWGDRQSMEVLKRHLELIGGKHMVVDGYICPTCGAAPRSPKEEP